MQDLTNDLSRISSETRQILDRGGKLLIAGQWCQAARAQTIEVRDPSSGRVISSLARGDATDIDAAVTAASAALDEPTWSGCTPLQREHLLHRLADLVEQHAATLAELESIDVGMPLWMAQQLDLTGSVSTLRYMAGWPSRISGQTVPVGVPIPGSQFLGYTVKEPVGVVGTIIPWNVPLMMAVWKLAPALAAGCTVVLKPAEDASLSVLLLGELTRRAGFPPGVVNIVTGDGAVAGEALVRHPGVAKISFTGSTITGRRVASLAAETNKKLTLELGGKSPQLLFADADLDQAIPGVAGAIFLNSGQVCVAGSRLYVQRPRYDEVVERLADHARRLVIGPGLRQGTEIGPLVSERQQTRVRGYVNEARADGATLVAGEASVDAEGYYIAPTVISQARQSMRAVQEEIFGPVLTVMPFDDIDEAVVLANDSPYGLSACVWTQSLSTAHAIIPRLKTGKVAVNTEPMPYPGLPEGGRKASGYGRNLGEESVESCLETKSVLIRIH